MYISILSLLRSTSKPEVKTNITKCSFPTFQWKQRLNYLRKVITLSLPNHTAIGQDTSEEVLNIQMKLNYNFSPSDVKITT